MEHQHSLTMKIFAIVVFALVAVSRVDNLIRHNLWIVSFVFQTVSGQILADSDGSVGQAGGGPYGFGIVSGIGRIAGLNFSISLPPALPVPTLF